MKVFKFNATVSESIEWGLTTPKIKNLKSKVALDMSFNSPERWKAREKTNYVTSLVMGMAPSKIVIANIKKCMSKFNKDSPDYAYYKKWLDRGFEYIAVDGNNRTVNLSNYLAGNIPLMHGEYNIGNTVFTIDSKNDTYNKHPKAFREYIDTNTKVAICEYTTATRADLHLLFGNINDGNKLNNQEDRNSILVPYAEFIRNLVDKHAIALNKIQGISPERRQQDELLVALSVYSAFGYDNAIGKKQKDDAYQDNSSVSNNFETVGKKNIEYTLNLIKKYASKGFKDTTTMNLFIAICELNKQKRKILDDEAFFKKFMATENKRLADTEYIYVNAKRGQSRNYNGCCSGQTKALLTARYDAIMKDVNAFSNKIVKELDPERLFTTAQRYELWSKQNGICPKTKKEIPEYEIQNHDLWAADHIIPHSKGGPTTIDNGQLVCKDYNLSKGSKSEQQMKKLAA
jgi:hypothetical protein